jgi:hypothetical protein
MRKLAIMLGMSAMLLAACGGSSTSLRDSVSGSTTGTTGTSTTGTTGTTGTTTPTVTAASLTATSSVSSIPSDGSATATITVLARNASNDLISGVAVSFAASSGGIAVTQATTDATGAATATLSTAGDSAARTIVVTATASGLTATVNVQVAATSAAATSAVASLTTSSSIASLLSNGTTTATISALAKDGANNALAGVPVTFSATSGSLQVTLGTTDATGTATATLTTGGDSTARTITVTAKSASLSATVNVPVVAAAATPVYSMGNGTGSSFAKGVIALGEPSIGAGGATGFTITIVDQTNTLYTAGPVTISLSSPCIASGQAQILASGSTTAVTSLTTSTGSVSGTYVAAGCSGTDAITASATVSSQLLSATGTETVAAASVGSIQFESATPTTIGLKGTGLSETSTVIFKVTDSTGAPKPGVTVTFAPDTVVGGIALSPASAISAADGTVQTVVSSGTVHTVVRVTASIATPALSTESSQLTVTTGLPASSGFSISVGSPSYNSAIAACPNVESYGTDGVIVPVTVFLADRYNNPVPDGTAVAFTTNGGHIDGSCLTGTANGTYTPVKGEGSCTVSWTSANPRPMTTDSPPVLANGRATILATAVGEESFTDVNGSGFYQAGDSFSHLGEPFLSANESTTYVSGDYFLDYNHNGQYDGPSNSFVGITCTGTTATSSCTTSTLALGAPHLLIMSTSGANITLLGAAGTGVSSANGVVSVPAGGTATLVFNVQDQNCEPATGGGCKTIVDPSGSGFQVPAGNSMAAGTSIASAVGNTLGTYTQSPSNYVVGCASDLGGATLQGSFVAGTAAGASSVVITVTSPMKVVTSYTIPINIT